MTSKFIAGGATIGARIFSDTDGAVSLQVGPDGSKIDGLTIDASGNVAVLGNLTQAGGLSGGRMVLAAAQNTTSGTSIDFTSIPSWAKRITVMLSGVSVSGTSQLLIQLGKSGGPETTGYDSTTFIGSQGSTVTAVSSVNGFMCFTNVATYVMSGSFTFTNITGNTWVCQGVYGGTTTTTTVGSTSGTKTLAGTLDRIRLTTVNGTDTFDAGSVNILYEG